MSVLEKTSELNSLLDEWREVLRSTSLSPTSPVSVLDQISTLLETAAEEDAAFDRDPFDTDAFARAEPDCVVGHLLKHLYNDDKFLNKVTTSYVFNSSSDATLNAAACRVLLNLLPVLDGSDLFGDVDIQVERLFKWAIEEREPLRSYATALLETAMNIEDCPATFKSKNAVVAPIMIQRLKVLSEISDSTSPAMQDFKLPVTGKSRFIKLSRKRKSDALNKSSKQMKLQTEASNGRSKTTEAQQLHESGSEANSDHEKTLNGITNGDSLELPYNPSLPNVYEDLLTSGTRLDSPPGMNISQVAVSVTVASSFVKSKNSSYRKCTHRLSPLTIGMQQRCILRYLHAMGEYQEILPIALELDLIDIILHYIDLEHQPDAMLACEALRACSAFLCHKKFISEFISSGGIDRLLKIPQPSKVATMSSLCFFYIAYSEDAIERICLLPVMTLHGLVEYELSLLEFSHLSGRNHAALFFGLTFKFRAILELFNRLDGLRKVTNMISTLKIMRIEEADVLSDDHLFMDRETAKNAVYNLKNFCDATLACCAAECRRHMARTHHTHPPAPVPHYKAQPAVDENVQTNISILVASKYSNEMLSEFVHQISELSLPTLLLQLVAFASQWKSYNYKSELLVNSLSVLLCMTVSRYVQLHFCRTITVASHQQQTGVKVLVRAAEGDLVQDVDVQKAALQVLCNCICRPDVADILENFVRPNVRSPARLGEVMRDSVRATNGIKVLLSLVRTKQPLTEADAIRLLAIKALFGLSHSDTIRQILGKLPLFHNDELQSLTREPILSDNQQLHNQFTHYANSLIKKVTGKSLPFPEPPSISGSLPVIKRLAREDIVTQTRITYPSKELLSIIHAHLKSNGLHKSADILQVEASLVTEQEMQPLSLPEPPIQSTSVPALMSPPPPSFTSPTSTRQMSLIPRTPQNSVTRTTSISAHSTPRRPAPESETKRLKFRQQQRTPIMPSGTPASRLLVRAAQPPQMTTLDAIVKNHLREQHMHCVNPVSTCPPFSLLRHHRCPEPRFLRHAAGNMTRRIGARQVFAPHGGIGGAKRTRKFVYSRFRSRECVKDVDDESAFTVATWMPNKGICLGTQLGEVKIFPHWQHCEEFSPVSHEPLTHTCHSAPISTLNVSRDGKLFATSAPYGMPLAAVWTREENNEGTALTMKMQLPDDNFVQFSYSEDRLVGTHDHMARVYDLTSGQLVQTFYDAARSNSYQKNYACFGGDDQLLLNDGCLWDVRAGQMIHKFDKFNDYVSGVFHPSNLEVIINSEVWDVRTFHLLETCPALDQCRIAFSTLGDVIYAVKHIPEDHDLVLSQQGMLGPFESSFRTFDAYDFSSIGTVDVRKPILDLKPNTENTTLAVIEYNGSSLELDTTCRLYNLGSVKHPDDENEDESDEKNDDGDEAEEDIADLLNDFLQNGDDDDDQNSDASFDAHLADSPMSPLVDDESDDDDGDDDDDDDDDGDDDDEEEEEEILRISDDEVERGDEDDDLFGWPVG